MDEQTTVTPSALSQVAQEFLVFTLGPEAYAIDILKVQEIRGYDTVTEIGHTPAFIKGVINLRGAIVPVVDMRIKLAVGVVEYTPFTVVVFVRAGGRVIGMVVDNVSDVMALTPDQIQPAPTLSAALDSRYIKGMAVVDNRTLIIIDIDKLMLSAEMALVDEVA